MRHQAEEALTEGVSLAEVCRSFGLSRNQWKKHRHHVTSRPLVVPTSLKAVRAEVLEGGGGPHTVIPRLEGLLLKVDVQKDRWSGKPQVQVALLRLERDILGDIAKLRGEFPDKPRMSLDQLPQWAMILGVLDSHPDARRDIVRALHDGD
jgi:transposase-like protein